MQYVGLKNEVNPEEVEMLLVKGLQSESDPTETTHVDPYKDELHFLEEDVTLSELQPMHKVNLRNLVCSACIPLYIIDHVHIINYF